LARVESSEFNEDMSEHFDSRVKNSKGSRLVRDTKKAKENGAKHYLTAPKNERALQTEVNEDD
jgi:hypothetical protein